MWPLGGTPDRQRREAGPSHLRAVYSVAVATVVLLLAACSGGSSTPSTEAGDTESTTRELRVPGTEVLPEEEETNQIIEGDDESATTTAATSPPTTVPLEDVATGVELDPDLAYNDGNALDVYSPAENGLWPMVVVFPGRGSDKSLYAQLAGLIAERGAVVVVANWRGRDQPPLPVSDSRCAFDAAIEMGPAYGGDINSVTVIGAAFGVVPASGIAFDGPWLDYEIERGCEAAEADVEPVAFVGMIGDYDSFDGLGADDELYQSFSPFSQIGDGVGPRVRILHGIPDALGEEVATSQRFVEAARDAGYDTTLVELDYDNLSLFGVAFDEEAQTVSVLPPDADTEGVEAAVDEIMLAVRGGPAA